MANGTKCKKMLIVLCVFLLLPLALIGCGGGEVSFEENNTVFFRSLLTKKDRNKINIVSLTAYNLEHRFFYNVVYSYNDEFVDDWTEIELIYAYTFTALDLHFNIEQGSTYFSDWHSKYINAVNKGVKKEFTSEEIAQYFNNFYDLSI